MDKWRKKTLGTLLNEVTSRNPSKECMVFEAEHVTYEDLNRRSDELALGLLDIGIKKGDNVALLVPNSPEWVYCFFALGKIGAVTVPVNLRFKSYELEYILSQSDSRSLIMVDRVHETNYLDMIGELCPEIHENNPSHFQSKRFPLLRSVVLLGNSSLRGAFSFKAIRDRGRNMDRENLDKISASVDPDEVALIQYTSGTTSFPKGAMLTHNSMLQDAYFFGKRMRLIESDRVYGPLPFYHVGGAVLTVLVSIVRGLTFFSVAYFDPEESLRIIEREKCTVLIVLTTHAIKQMEHPKFDQYDISTLRTGMTGGGPELITKVWERMGIKGICNLYGLSEASPNVTLSDPEDPFEIRRSNMGKPHPGVEVKIVDIDTGRELPPGKEGEICVKGWNVMKGYYNKPKETQAAIDDQGWLHTGDFGRLDFEGYLTLSGRVKNMVKVGGENVSLEEIEDFLFRHPKILYVEVIGVPDPKLDEVCMAFVQLREGQQCSEQEIIDFCKGKIARFKVPRYVRFVTEFPTTGSGKIQKYELRRKAIEELGLKESNKK